jgi:uncharacterized membrane protein YhaH (DUF805 family)
MQDRNPYAAPQTNVTRGDDAQAYGEVRIFSVQGRLGRVRYIGYSIGLAFLIFFVLGVAIAMNATDPSMVVILTIAGYLLALAVQLMLSIQRAHDMNATGWLALVALIPLVNLLFWFVPGTHGENDYGKPPPPNTTGVILLACVVPVVFIGGIVAAIAIPAYQDYTIRAQVSEGLNLAAAARAAVAETYRATSAAPPDRVAAGMSAAATDSSGSYVESVDIAGGTIVVTYGAAANPFISGTLLAIQPYVMPDKSVVWRCGESAAPGGAAPMDEFAPTSNDVTDIDTRFLPSACRP